MVNTEKIVVQVVVKGEKDLQKVGKSADKSTKSFGKMAAGIAAAGVAFATINKAIGSAIRTFRDYEFQMAKVKAITGASNKDFIKLSKTAQDLGRSTFFTAEQVAKLQTNFGKLGFSTKEILKAQKATLDLATATDSDLARAAIVAGAAVRGFGLDAAETQRVADVMGVAFTSSALDIEKFQTSMTKVAPIAAGANISLEATTAVMGTLTDAGIEASIAGTSLRNIFLKMQDPASDLSKHLGFTVTSSDDLQRALDQLNAEGLSNAEMMELVDLRQVAAFQTMINGSQNVSDLTFELEQSNGASEEMARIVGDNLEGAFKRLTSAWEGLQIVVSESVFGKGLQNFIDGTSKLFNNFTKFIEEPIEETLNRDRIAMNALAIQTMNLAEGTDERRLAIIELQKKYPDYFKNLDSEKTKNDDLKTALSLANEQYIQRIVLRKQEAEMEAVAEEAADAFNKSREESSTATEAAIKLNEDYNLGLDLASMSLEEQRKAVTALIVAQSDYTDDADPLLLTLTNSAKRAEIATKKYDDLTIATGDLGEEYKKLKDEFGLPDEITTPKPPTGSGDIGGGGGGGSITTFESEKERINKEARELQNIFKQGLVEKEITQQTFDQVTFDAEQQRLQNQLDLYIKYAEDTSTINGTILDNELKMISEKAAAEKAAFDKKVAEDAQEKKDREDKINEMQDIGNQLIFIAGEEKNLQGVKQAGIAISKAAAIATSFEAMADYGKAIANAAADSPWYLKIINVVGLIASMASTLSLIKSMKSSFGDGGMIEEFANGGMVHGKSHAQGGEKFAVGGRVVELEGGEAVINKRSTAMFSRQLSAMNSAGGGVKFADGGLLNIPSFSQQQFNAIGQNQMMGAMGSSGKVVVVEADITDSQNSVSVIQSEATI